jgi:hypothetical protein
MADMALENSGETPGWLDFCEPSILVEAPLVIAATA